MIDAFGVERISKSGVGAGIMKPVLSMPKKVRTRQLERLRAGKPQVASIRDQTFNYVRGNPINFNTYIPKNAGTEISIGRKKHKTLIHDKGDFPMPREAGAVTVPNIGANTNHIVVPDKSKKTGIHAFYLEHEKTHAQRSPRHMLRSSFKTRNQRLGEEARADATATLKTGRRTVPSAYPLANNRRYNEVYTKIV